MNWTCKIQVKCKKEIYIAFNLEYSDLETLCISFANKNVDFVIVVELLDQNSNKVNFAFLKDLFAKKQLNSYERIN